MARPRTGDDDVPEWVREAPQAPVYREPESRQYARDDLDSPCTEAGCTKTLREHIAEAHAIGLHHNGVLRAMQQRSADSQRVL